MRNLLLVTFFLALLVPMSASAQGIHSGDFGYKATQSKSKNEKIIKKGIEAAIEDMSFITRPIARGRLEDANKPFSQVDIKLTPKKVTINLDKRGGITAPVDGKPVDWTRKSDGKKFKVSQIVKPQLIIQTFFGEDGKKVVKYKFDKDYKNMTMEVVLSSPKLSGPLKYSLKYAQK